MNKAFKSTFLYLCGILLLMTGNGYTQSLSLQEFEDYVVQAKKAGATHIEITGDIPPSLWQMEKNPEDPYPAWFIYQPAIMKIFPPEKLQSYMDMEYARQVQELFVARSEIIHKHGLKAFYSTNEPHILPEEFFIDYPLLRGPRVDQVNRSRTARFAPDVDRPEMLDMYREAMQMLLEKLPTVEKVSFLTTDSGSGLCWSQGLYPGKNGPAWCEHRPMADRVKDFMMALKEGAEAAGIRIQVEMHGINPRQWMLPTFEDPQKIDEGLPEGFSVSGHKTVREVLSIGTGYAFYPPILGVPNPLGSAQGIMDGLQSPDTPVIFSFPPIPGFNFGFKLYQKMQEKRPANDVEMLAALREMAVEMAGESYADDLMVIWQRVYSVDQHLEALNFGPVFIMGNMLGRWVNRPMVPFPEDLTEEEKSYYRPYLFQAKGEEQANNLIDIQAMRMFEGYGARLLVQRVTELAMSDLNVARQATAHLIEGAGDLSKKTKWELLDKRLAVVESFTRTVDNMVGYQALLDLAKSDGIEPESNPVLGTRGSWKRQELTRLARDEAENAAELRELLLNTESPLIHTAPSPELETIRRFSPELPDHLKRKIDIMMAHWLDYNRLFTRPNP